MPGRSRIRNLVSIFLITISSTISANEECCECEPEQQVCFPLPQSISVGPEIYHIHRVREGGSKQCGWMYGVRATYHKIKRYKIYWGAEFLWARGEINGKSGGGAKLKSKFTDESVEGRVGYTFQCKSDYQPFITPFIGYGYFRETNEYRKPSPMLITLQNRYKYLVAGFMSGFSPCEDYYLGLNFKAMPMWQARCKITNDPQFDTQSMLIKDEINYRVELPMIYIPCICGGHLDFRFIPFYESRHYGRRENFPFDFLDTKFRIFGADLQISFRF